MDRKQFLTLLLRPTESTSDEWTDIQRTVRQYPYCAPLQLLKITSDNAWSGKKSDKETIRAAALYVTDRTLLNNAIAKAKTYEVKQEDFDILKEINEYQEPSIKATSKKEILSTLVNVDDLPADADEGYNEEVSVEALAKNSINLENTLMTETLALVFEKQGKKEKAIEVYEKLMEKYPEKSSTFASRIAALRS